MCINNFIGTVILIIKLHTAYFNYNTYFRLGEKCNILVCFGNLCT